MKRAYCFALLLALSTSLTVSAGDKEKVSDKIAAAIEKKTQEKSSSSDGDSSVSNTVAEKVRANVNSPNLDFDRDRLDSHRDNYRYTDYNLNVASCPFGQGTAEYDSLRYKLRDLTDAELWKICLNRNAMTVDGNSGACACALLASPDPWRPVDTPHTLERADEPIGDSGPRVSEK